jgi:hypothetical protein
VVKYNVIDGNGEGVIFGDLSASNNEVAYNIISNSNVRWNVESYWGTTPLGVGNTLHDNCVWSTRTDFYGTNNSIASDITGVTVSNTVFADPLYTNVAAHNFSLQSGSPCQAMGPQAAVSVTGDVNGDGHVSIVDLSIVLSNFGKSTSQASNPKADVNNDGKVTIIDLSMVLSNYGK